MSKMEPSLWRFGDVVQLRGAGHRVGVRILYLGRIGDGDTHAFQGLILTDKSPLPDYDETGQVFTFGDDYYESVDDT